ncbi:hypothetical protein Acr_25g0000160 [Actinidia rufa]|uniref:Uncharacterized protein n=1 Tax=Actinidia rufa TaxID=165716 RepID=A0A7J0GXP9_9ERIC|nr:hypothetical protein Acr_25g0000160 [Actinidia rufa]
MRLTYLVVALLYAFLSSSCLATTQLLDPPTNTTVLDLEDHELQSTRRYYIFLFQTPSRGDRGLALSPKDGKCPHYVMQETLDSSNGLPLRVEKYDGGIGYKIVYCPGGCGSYKVVCGDGGVGVENGKKWLGLSDEPRVVMFKKA